MLANYCVIVVGYNRPDSMRRLLKSLDEAEYFGDKVDLLISIDKGEKQQELIRLAEKHEWRFGEKKIRAFSEKQGLKSHILKCGDVSEDYKAVIVLEDDITVAQNFYNYSRSCVEYYGEEKKIAGISLYKHCFNVDAGAFFEPSFNGSDVFLMQYAQSWGQCWTKRMWKEFREWYSKNENIFDINDNYGLYHFPPNIATWSQQSWLKYHIAYLVVEDLLFVYPHVSVTTNHTELGQHNRHSSSDYQVMLPQGVFQYRLQSIDEMIKYDAFFERLEMEIPGFTDKQVIVDLYGRKYIFRDADILVSTSIHPYKIIDKWKLKLRPHEMNCSLREKGTDIFVYDLHDPEVSYHSANRYVRTRYDVRAINYKKLLALGMMELNRAIRKKVNGIRERKKEKKSN